MSTNLSNIQVTQLTVGELGYHIRQIKNTLYAMRKYPFRLEREIENPDIKTAILKEHNNKILHIEKQKLILQQIRREKRAEKRAKKRLEYKNKIKRKKTKLIARQQKINKNIVSNTNNVKSLQNKKLYFI